jgi:hypothetical protein
MYYKKLIVCIGSPPPPPPPHPLQGIEGGGQEINPSQMTRSLHKIKKYRKVSEVINNFVPFPSVFQVKSLKYVYKSQQYRYLFSCHVTQLSLLKPFQMNIFPNTGTQENRKNSVVIEVASQREIDKSGGYVSYLLGVVGLCTDTVRLWYVPLWSL